MKIDIDKRDFFKDPFSETELKKIIKMTGKKPSELLRKRDKMFKELDLDNKIDDKISRINFTSNCNYKKQGICWKD